MPDPDTSDGGPNEFAGLAASIEQLLSTLVLVGLAVAAGLWINANLDPVGGPVPEPHPQQLGR